ncbi:MAG: tetratricopeptide repeat protein [Planctomycetaceae bacterium]|nr:tetratricopeptide repeat protein [Planctomycetaceae bacterium]
MNTGFWRSLLISHGVLGRRLGGTQPWLPRMLAGIVFVGGIVGGSEPTGWACLTEIQESQDSQKSEDAAGEKQDEAKQAEQEDGTADFEKATELKLNARRPMDLDKVVQLCESALKKGLDPATEEFCRRLMLDSLMEYARISSARILTPQQDPRWRFLRGEALKRLTKVVGLEENNVEAWMLIAKLNLLETGDREQGAAAIAKVIELSADNKTQMAEALLVRAGFAEDDEQRLADLNQAVEVDPKNIEVRRARAIYFMRIADNAKAILDFQAILEAEPTIENRLLLANVMMEADQLDQALELLAAAEAADGEFRPQMMMAQIYFRKKEYEKCLENVDKVLGMVQDLPEATNMRILSLLQLERHEEALAAAEEWVEKMPNNPQGYWLRSIANSSLDKFDEAIQDLQFLVESVPDAPLFKLQLANLYNASDRPRAALKIFEELQEESPDLEGFYRSRGDAYLSTGQHAEAIADYEKELAKNPDDSGTLNNLAWVLATSPTDSVRNGARAIELGLKAAELTKYEQAHILSTLASGYAETGDFEKAREWIAKAVAIAEAEKAKNLDGLKKEAASYDKNEPWRELEVKEEAPLPEAAPKRRPRQRPPTDRSDDDF